MEMKRAFLVGINDYPYKERFQGNINDNPMTLVKYFGFASTDIVMLRSAQRNRPFWGLKFYREKRDRDSVVFHYSPRPPYGHGGDEPHEIICPWDFDWDGTYIKDDDFAAILGELKKGISLEIILDSCHSGTGTREMIIDRTSLRNQQAGLLDESALWASSHCIRPRYLAPPADIALRADDIFPTLKLHRIGE
jgi:hypothetical protein